MKKILFVGETCTISQTYTKGYDHVTISRYAEAGRSMVDALKENGIDIELFPIHLAHSNFLDTLETLNQYSVVIFSDIGSNTFLVPPQTHANAVRMPNRLKLIKEYVSRGGGFLMWWHPALRRKEKPVRMTLMPIFAGCASVRLIGVRRNFPRVSADYPTWALNNG